MVDTSTEKVERLARRLLQESASATRLSSRERLVTAARMLRALARERDLLVQAKEVPRHTGRMRRLIDRLMSRSG
ncbi:hypothetical protein GCM10008026_18360 [Chelatococcus composti]|jgi:hypothetical protein|uniref:Uncharacterized protein n=1 Tax=Chelatococcus composti TaxID=1743235 RepID=A0A841K7U2_9HYPH|nr:hypothetical protein [Chelatococcus composti]PZN42156.1 MAG: hypothetical protein DIU59_08085 [Pseudomonadota bacterium]GGG37802.1 hypothetical protein GCM10008026_18360 [Chelatococcus composti]